MPERVKWKRTSVTSVTPYTKGTLVFYVRPVSTLVFCTRPASSSSSMRSRRRNLDTVLTDSIHPSFSFFLSLARSISISLPLSLPFSLSLSLSLTDFFSFFSSSVSVHLSYVDSSVLPLNDACAPGANNITITNRWNCIWAH